MPIITPHQSQAGIMVGNASVGGYRSASDFMTPGAAALPGALQQVAHGLGTFGHAMQRKQQEQDVTDMLADELAVKDAHRSFWEDYQKNNKGEAAREAAKSTEQFFQSQMEGLQQKWGNNPRNMLAINKMMAPLRERALGHALAYSNQQEHLHKQAVSDQAFGVTLRDFADLSKTNKELGASLGSYENSLRMLNGQRHDQETGQWVGGVPEAVDAKLMQAKQTFHLERAESLIAVNRLGEARNYILANARDLGGKANNAMMMIERKIDAAEARAERRERKESAVLLRQMNDEIHFAIGTGDFSRLENMERKLMDLNQVEGAADLRKTIEVYKTTKDGVDAVRELPFAERPAAMEKVFSGIYRPDNAAMVDKVKAASMAALQREQTSFLNDPTGYVRSLEPQGESEQADAGKTSIAALENMQKQAELGKGIPGFFPQVLTAAAAKDTKELLKNDSVLMQDKFERVLSVKANYGDRLGEQAFSELGLGGGENYAASMVMELGDVALPFARDFFSVSLMKDSEIPNLDNDVKKKDAMAIALKNKAVNWLTAVASKMPTSDAALKQSRGVQNTAARMFLLGLAKDLKELSAPYDFYTERDALLRIPKNKGIDVDDAARGLRTVLDTIETRLPKMEREKIERLKQRAFWLSTEDNRAVLMNEGMAVPGKDGKPITEDLREAASIRPGFNDDWW